MSEHHIVPLKTYFAVFATLIFAVMARATEI